MGYYCTAVVGVGGGNFGRSCDAVVTLCVTTVDVFCMCDVMSNVEVSCDFAPYVSDCVHAIENDTARPM